MNSNSNSINEIPTNFNLVVHNPNSTVVGVYEPIVKTDQSYQSEAELEAEFIKLLESQAYERLRITNNNDLVNNLRIQLSKLNNYEFSDTEWDRFYKTEIANTNQGIEDKTATIQENHIKNMIRDDGTVKNIILINKESIHDNSLQVINQYATDTGVRPNRYDVTILVNGLPMVHIELKRRGVAIQEAFNQIDRYQRESFWADSGLYEYIQLFVISNGTNTKYYSNTTRYSHLKDTTSGINKKGKKTSSNSFEFTSWWADSNNRPISDLMDFGKTFFAKHTLLNILIKYCVFNTERKLMVMRPYQIVATERILNRIEISTNYKKLGTIDAGGYIWHTTGSGKTLTSFKTAQLITKLPYIDKVLFIVDRKDLDYQTVKEYDKFEKGSANSNASTAILAKQLEDPNCNIIITTIQKLERFINKNKGHTIFNGHVVLIFDECHRSQFGEMHNAITKAFKNYHIFGFTGTPIFALNSTSGGRADLKTTEQVFGTKLHTYTIVDAISDKNVLPFKVDYIRTVKEAENIEDKKITDINREAVLIAPQRITKIVEYIIEHYYQKTMRMGFYSTNQKKFIKLNSIFAVSSIEFAKKYYQEFQKQLQGVSIDKFLKVVTIFSYGANEAEEDFMDDENSDDTSMLDVSSRDFLENAIKDYNSMFGTSYDTSSDKFPNYYKDVSNRVKNGEIDILIVVNMFLTGFDAPTLNTLWVDKNLRNHGLLQAYSRTNRILNSIKTFGNIVCFRNLETATNKAISLFGNKDAQGIVLLKSYKDYYEGYNDEGKQIRGYQDMVEELLSKFPTEERIISEKGQKEFINLFSAIIKVKNILNTFDEFENNNLLPTNTIQDYQSKYYDIYDQTKKQLANEKEYVNEDIIFELELLKQVEINIDFIISLIAKYQKDHNKDKEILVDINRAIDSSIQLRNKKELINQFITSLSSNTEVEKDWVEYVNTQKNEELNNIIDENKLIEEKTLEFIKTSFNEGYIDETGTALSSILPPISRFSPDDEKSQKRNKIIEILKNFFEKYFDISEFRN